MFVEESSSSRFPPSRCHGAGFVLLAAGKEKLGRKAGLVVAPGERQTIIRGIHTHTSSHIEAGGPPESIGFHLRKSQWNSDALVSPRAEKRIGGLPPESRAAAGYKVNALTSSLSDAALVP
ncbi:hypothetical protein EYF80_066756 [Liparis tanakae]|uniref:Uncharacterized protein n=1 Tax=Liparis tanakae TaxID=230148 RepID=A0A4Z2E2J5_9TELE|nr:hypothetical protein EYF80_066756 [Liparis tanakae]